MSEVESRPTLTVMFCDLQDSTRFWEQLGDSFRPILARHDALISACLARWSGTTVKTQGDSFMVVFANATDAVDCAADIQRAFAHDPWPEEVGALLVRVGLHTGEPIPGVDAFGHTDYHGPVVNRAARLTDAAHGGQILISSATHDLVRNALPADLEMVSLGRFQLRGIARPEEILEVRCRDLPPRAFPPLRALGGLRSNLPMHLSAFVGREAELARLADLLAQPFVRLLTILGPPGCGKTRLAHELGAASASRFSDGVWLADLHDLPSEEAVLPHLAAALRVEIPAGASVLDHLAAFLRDRALLLVLDGFEGVAGAAPHLHRLLIGAPRVQCIVTSRSELGLDGERIYHLDPMVLPSPDLTDPAALASVDSVALFVDRVRAVRGDFDLTDRNASLVAALCRRLEGIPLALELAASAVAHASLADVADDLAQALDVLAAEGSAVPDRHRTLGRAVEWSYGLLAPDAQQALQRLSVFSGGWLRDAAQAVLDAGAPASVRTLCRHSLVSMTERQDGSVRWWMLGMIREYARARLQEDSAHAQDVADRHARHYLSFGEARVALLRTVGEAQAMDDLAAEFDNLRAAFAWSSQVADAALSARLALVLYEGLFRAGLWEEARQGLHLARAAFDVDGEEEPSPDARALLARLDYALAALAYDLGHLADARVCADAALVLCEVLGDHRGAAECLNLLGLIALEEVDLDRAEACFRAAFDARSHDDHVGLAVALHNLALVASRREDRDDARRLYERALAYRRSAGDRRGEAETSGNLGALDHLAGDHAHAQVLYEEGLRIYRELRDRRGVAVMLNNLGELAEAEGDVDRAVQSFALAERLFGELGSPYRSISAGHLDRLSGQVGSDRLAAVRGAAEALPWQDSAP